MGTHNFGFPADSCQSTSDHLMGNCVRKYDQKIRRSDPASHVCAGLAEHFGFTSVFPADIRILSFHAFIPAKNHNTHKNLRLRSAGGVYLSGGLKPATETSRILTYPPLIEARVFPTEIKLKRLGTGHRQNRHPAPGSFSHFMLP